MGDIDPFQAPEPFRIDLEPHRETIVVAPRGELDVGSAPDLAEQLGEVLQAGFARIVIDLRGITFMDSTGLHVVLDAHTASRHAGVDLALIQGPSAVQRLFELTGTTTAMSFIEPEDIEATGR
jgi:anti-sigma B factor antagonist